jgi:hydrogenase-4 component F
LVTATLCWFAPGPRWRDALNVLGAAVTLVIATLTLLRVSRGGPVHGAWGVLFADSLSALMVITIAGVGFAAALFSVGYLHADLAAGHVPGGPAGVRWYFFGFHVFVWTMLATVTVASLGLLWVSIEATTLASALLVGFYRTKAALEAAWKYLILCTVGITLALFGVILTHLAASAGGVTGLDWTVLMASSDQLDPALMRLAFAFVLVGFGTKAGFAPLHTWLADAHSQAPSPVSAVLSGVLLSCAFYGILRFHTLTVTVTETAFSSRLLLLFGVLSVAVAVPFLIVQRDLKRLLAYSSVEHMGLLAVAMGIGGPLGIYAGLLHLINHAVTKTLLFIIAGTLVQRFGTRRMSAIRGVIQVAPWLGWGLLLGVLALAGAPPAGIFISELGIITAGFAGDPSAAVVSGAVVFLLGLAFAGLLAHGLRVACGVPLPAAAGRAKAGWLPAIAVAPLVVLVVLLGIRVPPPVTDLLWQVAGVLAPGGRP